MNGKIRAMIPINEIVCLVVLLGEVVTISGFVVVIFGFVVVILSSLQLSVLHKQILHFPPGPSTSKQLGKSVKLPTLEEHDLIVTGPVPFTTHSPLPQTLPGKMD